ncbi:RNA dependent RNA polymerase-domain-containing protein [Tuber brumale]|nr:RNA dependent RNA polymerase-domain-containing protein [Tuber brumale]
MTPPSAQLAPATTSRGLLATVRMNPREEPNDTELGRRLHKLNRAYGFHTHPKQPRPNGSGTRSGGPVTSPWVQKLEALLKFSVKEVDDSFHLLGQVIRERGIPRDRKLSVDVRIELEKEYESILDEKLAEFQDRDESVVGLFGIGSGDCPKEEPNTWPSDDRYETQKVGQDLAALNLGSNRNREDIVFKGRGKNKCGEVISIESRAASRERKNPNRAQGTREGSNQRWRQRKKLSPTEMIPGGRQCSPERSRNRGSQHDLAKPKKKQRAGPAQQRYEMKTAGNEQEAPRWGWGRRGEEEGEEYEYRLRQVIREEERERLRQEEQERRFGRTRTPLPRRLVGEDLGDPRQGVQEGSGRRRDRQPEPPLRIVQGPAQPVVGYEDNGTEPDSDDTFYSASSSVAELKWKGKAVSTELEDEYGVSGMRVSSSKRHEKRPILLDQGRRKEIRVPVKPVHRSYGDPFHHSLGGAASGSEPSSLVSSVFTRSITAGSFSPKDGTFRTDITDYDSPHDDKEEPVLYRSDTDQYDPQGHGTDNATEDDRTDVDEPEEDKPFYPQEKITPTPQAQPPRRKQKSAVLRQAERFRHTPLSPVPQSVVASETSEREELERAELVGFFDEKPSGPELLRVAEETGNVHWDFAAQQEAEEQSPDGMSDRGGGWTKPSPQVIPGALQQPSPGPSEQCHEEGKVDGEGQGGGGEIDGDDPEFRVDAAFEAEMLSLLPPGPGGALNQGRANEPLRDIEHPLHTLPFHVQYEATRVALSNGVFPTNSDVSDSIHSYCDDLFAAKTYAEVLGIMGRYCPGAAMLEKSAESAWRGYKGRRGWTDKLYMTGRVSLKDPKARKPEDIAFDVQLNPLGRSTGNRFFNRFGSDRFLTLRLPDMTSRGQNGSTPGGMVARRVEDWLINEEIELANRKWRCFYAKEGKSRKRSLEDEKTFINETFVQAVLFATSGVGIGDDRDEMARLGFRGLDKKIRREMSADELLLWHIPLEGNEHVTIPKFWSRISLGFSTAVPSFKFEPSQVEIVPDMKSTAGEIMNDGCSVVSPRVMQEIRRILDLHETPTAVQARLGGAKGVWMIDPSIGWSSDEIFIKVTASQLKYSGYADDQDWARMTLDILHTSHEPRPATINTQLIPILENRGVPFQALKELIEEHLEEDLDELFQVIDKPVELRKWIYDRGSVGRGRISYNGIQVTGSMPSTKHEMAILLLESGFLVRSCRVLMDHVRVMIDQYCEELKEKLHVRIPHSTVLLCVADPTGTLREGEVSLRFSNGFLDPKTLRRSQVITGDILVARNPAHIPSDIQKVKAVDIQPYHSLALRELQDVIVFSTQGNQSLASLLSGGDYDGDKPWVCWEERLVKPFTNSPTTYDEVDAMVAPWFNKSQTKVSELDPGQPGFFERFLRIGLRSSFNDNFLGQCTSIWEKRCYEKNDIADLEALKLAKLCSLLVDAPKQGMSLRPEKVDEIRRKFSGAPIPAYKEKGSRICARATHIIDRLFQVADTKVNEKQQAFHDDMGRSEGQRDGDIVELFVREHEFAQKDETSPLWITLRHLTKELTLLKQDWTDWIRNKRGGPDEFRAGVPNFLQRYRNIMPPTEQAGDPVVAKWAREGGASFTSWAILRASAAYAGWGGERGLVWYMAGIEICWIKCQKVSMRDSELGPRTMLESMYAPLVTWTKFISAMRDRVDGDVEVVDMEDEGDS